MTIRRSLAVLLLASSFTSSCVTVAGNQLRDIERATPVEVPRVEQTIGDFSFHLDGGKMITSIKAGRIFNDEVLTRWKKWGYVRSQTYVKSGKFTGNADYEITLSGTQNGESSILLQVLSGLTIFVIPYYVDTELDAVFEMKDRRTGKVYKTEAADHFNTVISLILLPVSPFAQGGRTKTWDRIAANLHEQLKQQGAFAQPVAVTPAP